MAAASAVIDRLLRRLAAIGPDELPSVVEEDMIHMKKAFSRWQVVLESTEMQLLEGISGERLEMSKALMSKENKMRKIKQIAYYIEDILDEFEGCGRGGSGGSSGRSEEVFCCSSSPSFLPSTMASRMKMVRKKLDRESEQSIIFRLLHHSKPDLVTSDGPGSSNLCSIIGRDNDKANVKKIINDAGSFSIIPIVGLSGIGKTALARFIFNDRGEDWKFDHYIWVNLNMSFDLCYIVNDIIAQAANKEEGPSQKNKWTLRNLLREVLTDKRTLVVLDDLWSMDINQLDELKEMMSSVICSVIVTTSSEEVAKLFNTVSPYKLGLLSDNDCWTIFSGVASNDQETRDHVVRLCQGMPVVAHSLSSMLHAKGKNVVKHANNKELWHLEKRLVPKVKMFQPLKKNYYRMPSGLKSCFGYLSIFPKEFHIDTEKLIWQWSALGMLGSNHGILSPYVQGKNYIQTLLSVFFLQVPEPCTANGMLLTNGKSVLEMHSLVHSFARYLSCDELIILEDQIAPVLRKKKVTFRYALLLECNEASTIPKGFLTRARAISFKGCKGRKLPEEALSALRHLNVLDLSGCSFLELPSSVGQLKHLRYLDVSHSAIQSLPSELRSLQSLEALDLSKTSVRIPLDPIGPFEKLKYLNLQECSNLRDLLWSFGHLKGLEHLNLSRCSGVSELPESLCGFSALQLLDLSSCAELEKLPQSFGSLKNLGELNLSGCSRLEQLPESFHELYSLKFLNLEICSMLQQLPHLFGNLKTLEILNLAGCISLQELPKSFGDLYFLRVLNLEGCFGLQESPHYLANLLNLENLNLSHISLELPETFINLRRLHTLDLTGCGLKKSFPDVLNKMTNLKFVLTDDSRLALSFSRHIIVSTENNKQACLASHMVQSSDLEGIMPETDAEKILETPETRKSTTDRANSQQETCNPFELIAMENKDSSGDVFGYSSENVECSAVGSLDTTIEMQPHRQVKEVTPIEEDPEDFNPRASSTLSSTIPVHSQNIIPENQTQEQGQEISEYPSDEQDSRNISGLQDGNLNHSTALDNLVDTDGCAIVHSGSDFNSLNVSNMSAKSIRRTQYPSFTDRPPNLRVFSFAELKSATCNFRRSLMVGEGSFGCVYRGVIKASDKPNEQIEIAVKQLNREGLQGKKEWLTEVNVLGIVDHTNLVKLIGYCAEDDKSGVQRLLVYEYLRNGSVDDHLSSRSTTTLSWPMRLKVALDSARGLKYLHEEIEFQVILRHLKPSNILLDENWNAKLSGLGFARHGPAEGLTHVSTQVDGTLGYAAPEYIMTGHFTTKCNIWSYGVLLYVLITGRRSIDHNRPKSEQKLLEWAKPYISDVKRFPIIVDPRLEGHYNLKSMAKLSSVANRCLLRMPKSRPLISEVYDMVQKIVDSVGTGPPQPPLLHYQGSASDPSAKHVKKGSLRRRLQEFRFRISCGGAGRLEA